MPSGRRSSSLACRTTRHELRVVTPYRLDLTVSALRRLASNRVDVYTADGRYLRALDGFEEPVVVCVTQPRPDVLAVTVTGKSPRERTLATVRRILGTERDVTDFNRRARRMPWLAPLARRMRGLKPPRYPTLWEACVNTIVYQQISLQAASSIMRRLIHLLSDSVEHEGMSLAIFPTVERFLGAPEAAIRAAGISAGKLAALRRAAEAIAAGTLSEAMVEERSSADGARLLCTIKGIGPWTAAVILIRGFGRLDTFPGNDSSVAANLALVAPGVSVEAKQITEMLGAERGMLYFCLLLARLESRGELGRASDVATANVTAQDRTRKSGD
jgi:DNA-3-methyladenine glycosylase II